jgi:hypothetical protein
MYCGPGKLAGATVRCIPAVVNNFQVAVEPNRPQLGLLENIVSACRHSADLLHSQSPFSCASSPPIIGSGSHPTESRKTCPIPYSIEDWKFLYSRMRGKVSSTLESSSAPMAATHNPVRMQFVAARPAARTKTHSAATTVAAAPATGSAPGCSQASTERKACCIAPWNYAGRTCLSALAVAVASLYPFRRLGCPTLAV